MKVFYCVIRHTISHIYYWLQRKYRYEKKALKFRSLLLFEESCGFSDNCTFEGCNKLYSNVLFDGAMGYGSYIAAGSVIYANIGRYTSIGPNVRTNLGIHPNNPPFVTTCPMFYSTMKQNGHTYVKKNVFKEFSSPISIGNDCWIGDSVFINGNVCIGDGAIVYAGSVVTKDVPPYAIVGGAPARIIRYRFDEETIQLLLDFKWWDAPQEWIEQNHSLLCDVEKLKQYIRNMKGTNKYGDI